MPPSTKVAFTLARPLHFWFFMAWHVCVHAYVCVCVHICNGIRRRGLLYRIFIFELLVSGQRTQLIYAYLYTEWKKNQLLYPKIWKPDDRGQIREAHELFMMCGTTFASFISYTLFHYKKIVLFYYLSMSCFIQTFHKYKALTIWCSQKIHYITDRLLSI